MASYKSSGQSLSSYNLNHIYNISESTYIKSQVIGNGIDAFIFLNIPLERTAFTNKSYAYFLSKDLQNNPAVYVPIEDLNRYRQVSEESENVFGLRTKNNRLKFFIFAVVDSTNSSTLFYPVYLPTSTEMPFADIVVYGEKRGGFLIDNFVTTGKQIKLNSLLNRTQKFKIDVYNDEFSTARPPMAPPPEVPPPLPEVDSTFTIDVLESFALREKGLLLIRGDSSEATLSRRVVDPSFPRKQSIEELVEAMRYLTTDEEYETMVSAEDKKKEFDEFWISNTQSPERAKKMIRGYFRRISEANTLFTSYKEGWKTDKGMIYTILGPPSKVYIQDQRENWIYSKSFELSTISFTFVKVETPYSNNHYVLERRADYKAAWFKAIELWRKGRKTL